MNRSSAEESLVHDPAHFEHLECKLIVMPGCHSQAAAFCQLDQRLRFLCCDCERFLQINVAARLKALCGQREMTLGRGGNVDDVRSSRSQHFLQIGEAL